MQAGVEKLATRQNCNNKKKNISGHTRSRSTASIITKTTVKPSCPWHLCRLDGDCGDWNVTEVGLGPKVWIIRKG
jgi:hypothetical protein